MATALDSRARSLRAALGFLSLEPREPELQLLHHCFDTWRGIDIVAGMARCVDRSKAAMTGSAELRDPLRVSSGKS
jgi:hypothetical protein